MLKRVLGASMLLLLVAAAPAAAVAPVQFSVTQTSVVQDQGQACGFPVRWDISLTVEGHRFFDNDGNLVRIQAHIRELNTITNVATGEVIVEGPDSFMQTNYIENGVTVLVVATGLAANVQSDPKILDVGRVAWIPLGGGLTDLVFLAGPHPVREAAEFGTLVQGLAAFCEAFS